MILLQASPEAVESIKTKVLIAMIAAIATLIAAVLAFIIGLINHNISKRQLAISNRLMNEQVLKDRKAEIYKKLNDFYGPFQQYLNTSSELYKLFFNGKPDGFRTLTFLLDPDQEYTFSDNSKRKVILSVNDETLLGEIFKLGEKMQALIVEKAGLVDNKELRFDYKPNASITNVTLSDNGLLAQAYTHFQIIRLAQQSKLLKDTDRFKNYVFPKELSAKIEAEIEKLQTELKILNS